MYLEIIVKAFVQRFEVAESSNLFQKRNEKQRIARSWAVQNLSSRKKAASNETTKEMRAQNKKKAKE